MKNAFSYVDGVPEGNAFLSRAPEGGLAAKKKASDEEAERFAKVSMLPKWLQIVVCIWLAVGAILLVVGLEMLTAEEEPEAAFTTVSVVLAAVGGGMVALGLAGILLQGVRIKKVTRSGAYVFFQGEQEKLLRELKEALGVPADSLQTDIFGSRSRTVKGKRKRTPYYKKSYLPVNTYCWREGEAFCVFDGDAVYKFPFENIIDLERIEKRVPFFGWNKTERFNRAFYKPYKIRYNNNADCYYIKPCYRVRLCGKRSTS